jgi:hypothetical protein
VEVGLPNWLVAGIEGGERGWGGPTISTGDCGLCKTKKTLSN